MGLVSIYDKIALIGCIKGIIRNVPFPNGHFLNHTGTSASNSIQKCAIGFIQALWKAVSMFKILESFLQSEQESFLRSDFSYL